MLDKVRDKLALYALRTLYGKRSDFACSFYGRDPSCKSEIADSASIGVVFQGPVIDELKLRDGLSQYRALLPASPIVLSTWEGSVSIELHAYLKSLQILCIECKPPAVGGIMNVNRQIISTGQGIVGLVQAAHPEIVVKARTDYFPWRPDKAISHIRAHEKLLNDPARIWGLDFNTRLDLPFSFADIFQIGRLDAMVEYWRLEDLYPNDVSVQDFLRLTDNQRNVDEILRLQPAEIFLARRYLDAKKCSYDYKSIIDYRTALAKWFGVLDAQHIEMAFGKYALAVPGYEIASARKKKYVKTQDWLAMIAGAP